jgi:transposase
VPQNYGENISLLVALGVAGVSAPMTVAGAVDTAVFRAWVEQVLGPTLRPGDIVVLDNLAVHQAAGIAEAIVARGARLEPLPPYSPDLNPIEQCWAKLKTAPRPHPSHARRRAQTGTTDDHFCRCAGLVHSLWLSGTSIGNPL